MWSYFTVQLIFFSKGSPLGYNGNWEMLPVKLLLHVKSKLSLISYNWKSGAVLMVAHTQHSWKLYQSSSSSYVSSIVERAQRRTQRNCTQARKWNCEGGGRDLTNWRQFFMRPSCYWSWISSYHCQSSCGSADYFDIVVTKSVVNNRTDARKTDVKLCFTITNFHNCSLSLGDAWYKL